MISSTLELSYLSVSGFTMLDAPVPIRSLKLSNIGPGYYLDGGPLQGISGSAGTSPPPPADRVQSFQTLCLNQVIETRINKKNSPISKARMTRSSREHMRRESIVSMHFSFRFLDHSFF